MLSHRIPKQIEDRTTGRFLLNTLLLNAAFVTALATPAREETTYAYLGNPFTNFTGVVGCSQPSTGQISSDTCAISGSFSVAAPLAANLFDAQIIPTNWQFTDGFYVWNPGPINSIFTGSGTFVITTDASGDITNWAISLVLSGTNPQNTPEDLILFTNNGEDFTEAKLIGVGVFDEAENAGMPGTWSASTTSPPATPEPGSLLLLGTGLLPLAPFFRRFVGASAGRSLGAR